MSLKKTNLMKTVNVRISEVEYNRIALLVSIDENIYSISHLVRIAVMKQLKEYNLPF